MSRAAKSAHQQRTCLQSLRIALNMAAVLGVVPYSLRGHNVVFGAWKLLFSVFCASILPLLGCYTLIFPNPKLTRSPFSMFVYVMQFVAYSISIISITLCNITYRGAMENVTIQLLKVERILLLLNAESKISYNRLEGILLPLFLMCCSAGHLFSERISDLPTLAMFLTFHYANFYCLAIGILIVFLVDSVHRCLDSLVHRASSWEVMLVHLCEIHDRLAGALGSIQKVYGLPILFMSLSHFAFVNCNVFIATKFIYSPIALSFIGWIIIVSSMTFRIFWACDRMKEKADEFYTVLYRIMKKDKTWGLLNNDGLRAHSLKRKSFSVNAAGFCQVDLKFFAGMISATVTYSVILLQMGKNF